ncbi:MOSC domain-containing protein [Jannaschia donghaensis]|uniref:Putative Fe-S protein n=1 Tax=Jannaschia donghaensis TaxID=420998 RepID=A0A0M6YJB6_9RHOB|nr:MOSC domain-containing protein [Jannaschia donghaensis]CTQ50014.1 putative Fe-S protein [Jannaschia donghaensis]
MSPALAQIWRHPIKAIGRERLSRVTLTAGRTLPHDRRWAVTHANAKPIDGGWAQKANFLRGVSGPGLMAITAALDEATMTVTLHHPKRPDLTVTPDDQAAKIVEWLDPVWPDDLPRPTGVVSSETGFTDVPDAWVSVHATATHRAVEQKMGRDLSIHRWRGNLWIDGLAPWEEFDLLDQTFRIGDAVLRGVQPITRCRATEANPETGRRDADTLGTLRTWDHQDFGIYAEVIEGGVIAPGAEIRI